MFRRREEFGICRRKSHGFISSAIVCLSFDEFSLLTSVERCHSSIWYCREENISEVVGPGPMEGFV